MCLVATHVIDAVAVRMGVPVRKNPRQRGLFGKRLMEFEPTTFCMAIRFGSSLAPSGYHGPQCR